MGRNRKYFKGKKSNDNNDNNNNLVIKDDRNGSDYQKVKFENEQFVNYYKSQNLFKTEEEFNLMLETFKTALPTTFRITGTRKQALELLKTLETQYIPQLKAHLIEGQPLNPEPIAFYPNNFGWTIDTGKSIIKKDPLFKKFQKFLVMESEVGNISRQETVSMIPPLLLDVKPEHWVLDMCAAPGSKTAQLIEALHSDGFENSIPKGMIIANDASEKRCYTLIHQIKRLKSPSFLVTNHEGQAFPSLTILSEEEKQSFKLRFDRILCDVPCSGDGTLRKNYLIWKDWSINDGNVLHFTQLNIAIRGLQLLKVGGRLVYSTCSLNPIENEAVVAELLNRFKDKIKLLNMNEELPELKRAPGVHYWKVFNKEGKELSSYEDFPLRERNKKWCVPSMFPPSNVRDLPLENCLRIYPHLQNTGGFFVAVFEKVASFGGADEKVKDLSALNTAENDSLEDIQKEEKELNNDKECVKRANEDSSLTSSPKRIQIQNEEPFIFLRKDSPELANIKDYFELKDFPTDLLVVRSELDKNKTVSLVSPAIKKILNSPDILKLKLVNTGVKAFSRTSSGDKYGCSFRLQNESLPIVMNYLPSKFIIPITTKDFQILLKEANPLLTSLSQQVQDKLKDLPPCSIVVEYSPLKNINYKNDLIESQQQEKEEGLLNIDFKEIGSLTFPAWKAHVSLNLNITKQEAESLRVRLFE